MLFLYHSGPSIRRLLLVSLLSALLPLLAVAGQLNAQVDEHGTLTLTAPAGAIFTSVNYASYGTPVANGDGTYTTTSCHESNSQAVVESYVLNKNTVSIPVESTTFADATHDGDPCFGTFKSLAVVVTYADPLPVVLLSFNAAKRADNAATTLVWATASELNSAHFEVQRSASGSAYTTIGIIAAQGSSASHVSYTFTDTRLPAGITTFYYRLRQVDTDGRSTYSPVRSVELVGDPALALYPNPVQTVTTLTGAVAYAPVHVFTLLGGLVLTTIANANGTATLTLPTQLLPGLYLVRTGKQVARLLVE